MYNEIYEKIKKHDTIVIVRHIGADPDSLASQLALRDSIRLTFPNKKVLAWGNSSARFDYFPRLDKFEELSDILLIVTDTPDKKRIDFSWTTNIIDSIKIDHHPYIETFCELEYIDDTASSASELILELINNTPLLNSDEIAKTIFTGIASDTNRFMFNASSRLLRLISNLFDEYNVDITEVYSNLYMRPLNEVRLQGYIAQNIVVSENGFGYVKISNDTLNKLSVDSGSAGNMVNNFNYIEGMYVWAVITEDIKNNLFKVNIRSRGPVINIVAEKYNGGGHKMASGARLSTMEEVDLLLKDLDESCKIYLEERVIDNED